MDRLDLLMDILESPLLLWRKLKSTYWNYSAVIGFFIGATKTEIIGPERGVNFVKGIVSGALQFPVPVGYDKTVHIPGPEISGLIERIAQGRVVTTSLPTIGYRSAIFMRSARIEAGKALVVEASVQGQLDSIILDKRFPKPVRVYAKHLQESGEKPLVPLAMRRVYRL